MNRKALASKTTSLLCNFVLLLATPLIAEEKTWTGAGDGSWANAGNWAPSGLVNDFDGVLYDSSSGGNLVQSLDQTWSITGLRVTSAPGPITILPGAGSFVLTNTGGIDMSAATADLTILADYAPVNNGTLTVPAGRTLTLSNILNNIIATPAAMAGAGTVRIIGSARRLNDQVNSITTIVDGGTIAGNPPVRLSADSGSTVTVIVTNNGALTVAAGNSARIRLGNTALNQSTNHLILDGGTVTVAGSTSSGASGIYIADAAGTVGILDINNGTIDLSDRSSGNAYSVIRMGVSADTRGVVNLNAGGRLLTPRIDRIAGYGVFNFNGGYLRATTTGDYFELVDEVNVLAGGAVVETAGNNLAAVFLAPLIGPGGLVKLGPGRLTLATNTTYAGPTTVSNGTLAVTLPMPSAALTISSNASLNVTVGSSAGASWTPSSIVMEGSNTITFTYAPESQPSSALLMTPSFSASGTNTIIVTGNGWPVGTTRLLDYGTLSGGATFQFGAFPIGLNARLTNNPTTTSIDLVVSSGVNNLDWYGFTAYGGTSGGLWDIATTANWNNGAAIYNEYGTGTNRLGDSVRFTPSGYTLVEITTTVRPSSVTISNLNTAQYHFVGAGKISGPTSLVKEGNSGNSTVMLSTSNDYTGGTYIRMGNIFLGTENALPTSGLVYVGSPGAGATLTLNGFNQTVAGIISAGSGGGNRRVLNSSFNAATLTINTPANQTNIYAHTMGNTGVANTDVANNFSVVKTGPGTQTFANSAYGGTTTVKAGTLLFNGSANSLGGAITVESGGALGGQTTGASCIGVPVTVQSGGRLEPGNLGIGTMTVSNSIMLQGETVMQINRLASPNADRLVANSLSLGGTLTVTNVGDPLQAGNTFTLFTGPLSGSFSGITLPPLPAGLAWNTDNLTVNGTLTIVSLPTPTFASFTLQGTNLVISGTGGPANGSYHVLTSTNVVAPLANWTTMATNTFDGTGAFTFTNSVNGGLPQQFFILHLP